MKKAMATAISAKTVGLEEQGRLDQVGKVLEFADMGATSRRAEVMSESAEENGLSPEFLMSKRMLDFLAPRVEAAVSHRAKFDDLLASEFNGKYEAWKSEVGGREDYLWACAQEEAIQKLSDELEIFIRDRECQTLADASLKMTTCRWLFRADTDAKYDGEDAIRLLRSMHALLSGQDRGWRSC